MNRWLAEHCILPLHETLRGRETFGVYRRLRAHDFLSADELRSIQLRKLQALVRTALQKTTCYADVSGKSPDWQPQSLEDIAELPLMDKTFLSEHREELLNPNVPGGPKRYRTGGSSGQPLIFYFDKRRQAWDKAARMLTHGWFGISPGDREAYIWNSPVELSKQDRMKRFRDWLTNEQMFPASELSPKTIHRFVEGLHRFRPDCLFGYPSAITLMCELADEAGLRLDTLPVRVVFSTAEVLYEHQVEQIQRSLGGVPVVNGYGSREAGFIAHECPEGTMHINDENVIVEVICDGRPARSGEDGEIVVTQLDNHAQPFIRYRTSDVGQLSEKQCPCGRHSGAMNVIKGRSNDFLVAPDGHHIHGSAVHAILSGLAGIRKFQVRQAKDHSVRVLLVTDAQFTDEAETHLRDGMLQRLGQGGRVELVHQDDIPPGPSGKFRYVISELSTLQRGQPHGRGDGEQRSDNV